MPKTPVPELGPESLPPLEPVLANRFKRDVARLKKRGEDMTAFKVVLDALCSREPLDPKLRDHALQGDWKGHRDCHVGPDWVIICRKDATSLSLARTGTHADLFG